MAQFADAIAAARADGTLWGARLSDVMIRSPEGDFAIDYGKFDAVEQTEMLVWDLQEA